MGRLNRLEADEICSLHKKGWSCKKLQRHFGISYKRVSNAIKGKTFVWDLWRKCRTCGGRFYALGYNSAYCYKDGCGRTRSPVAKAGAYVRYRVLQNHIDWNRRRKEPKSEVRLRPRPVGVPKNKGYFTDCEIIEIRERNYKGEVGRRLAREFCVSVSVISRLVLGKTYRRLPVNVKTHTTITCEYCGKTIKRDRRCGRKPKYCRPEHRYKARLRRIRKAYSDIRHEEAQVEAQEFLEKVR